MHCNHFSIIYQKIIFVPGYLAISVGFCLADGSYNKVNLSELSVIFKHNGIETMSMARTFDATTTLEPFC